MGRRCWEDDRTPWSRFKWAVKAQLPLQFKPPGAAGRSLGSITSFFHPVWVQPTLTLWVVASLLSGIGASLLVLAAFSYVNRRKRGAVTPLFFVLAVFSGFSLLALCAMHHNIALPRLREALESVSHSGCSSWSAAFDLNAEGYLHRGFFGADFNVVLPQEGHSANPNALFIFYLENISLGLLEVTILVRVLALFPDKRWVMKISRLLLLASVARFILSIGLRIPTSPPKQRDPVLEMEMVSNRIYYQQTIKLAEIFHIYAYVSAYLPFIANTFATWSFVTKWRHTKQVKTNAGYRGTSRKNDPVQRLRILIYAGLCLGLIQVSWHTYHTAISIEFEGATSIFPEWTYDYVLPRFLFHAGSALYPLATYVALHWNTPSEDVQCIDLIDIQDDLENDIPLDDLGVVPTGEDDRIGSAPLIDFDTPGVDADT